MKKLMKKLEDNVMTSRCPTVENCIEQIKKNNKPTVFINVSIMVCELNTHLFR